MSSILTRTALRKNAKSSRPAEVRSSGMGGERGGASWARPLRRSGLAIDASRRLIESAARVIDDAKRSARVRPIHASRQFQRVSGWLAHAAADLQRAGRGVQDATDCVVMAPDRAAGAPEQIIETTRRWADAMGRLATISNLLDGVFARLLDAAGRGIVQFEP